MTQNIEKTYLDTFVINFTKHKIVHYLNCVHKRKIDYIKNSNICNRLREATLTGWETLIILDITVLFILITLQEIINFLLINLVFH